jgi:Transposase DDE domain group 1
VLLRALREYGLKGTELAQAQCDTIRLRLLKIGAVVRVTVRRVVLALSEAFPLQEVFARVWENLPAANPLTTPGSSQNTHPQPQAQPAPQPSGWQPSVAAQAADPNTIPGMLLRHSERLLNRGQPMPPKRASSLPDVLQRLLLTNAQDGESNSAQTWPAKQASPARLVLAKGAQIKQAWGRYGSYHPGGGSDPPQGSGYPNR